MSIKTDVEELTNLDLEIKRLNKEIQKLRKAKKNCESRILDYCQTNNHPGLSFDNIDVYVDVKQRYIPNKKSEKVAKCDNVLKKYGLHNNNAVYEILNIIKGDAKNKTSLKIKRK